ncbi:MAG: hypothetical protein QOI03_2463 [Solirubrobacteraceae bacterium]|nr:hypothetical protein [Solirubrobacteraceae bacterium]
MAQTIARSDATSPPGGRVAVDALYLSGTAVPVFGLMHTPARCTPGASAVLMCPPFGWDEICCYRSRRTWAQSLALAGFPTMRIDLPGSGDSGGSPSECAGLAPWSDALGVAVGQLRRMTGVERVAAICIGLGGLVACKAISEGTPIDELVLWAVPARGRALLRELSVFASLEESGAPGDAGSELARPSPDDGSLWAGGFLLNADTVRELERLDLAELEMPGVRRALMLDRDGIRADERLRSHLSGRGVAVSVASGDGFGAMMAKPHHARAPRAVFARVQAWLAQAASGEEERERATHTSIAPTAVAAVREGAARAAIGDPLVHESPMRVPRPFGDLFGILSEPVDGRSRSDLCAVMLNAGAIRRVGPNRMWVEAARRWATLGVPTLRLDLEGIGDADGDGERFSDLGELYLPELVEQVRAALDALESRGAGSRFVLSGLCSGACWSFHGALRDERVAAAFMLNPQALFWDESLEAARDLRRGLRRASWQKLLRGEVPIARLLSLAWRAPLKLPLRAVALRGERRRGRSELDDALDRLRDDGKILRFMFSGGEPLYEELERDGYLSRLDRWPNVNIERLPGDVHTLRPLQSQQRAHEALDRALGEILANTSVSSLLGASR